MKTPVTIVTGVFLFLQIMQQNENPFSESMQSKSNQQLSQIVGSKRMEYEPLAILAAEQELARRNFDPGFLLEQKDLSGQEHVQAKSEQVFEWYHKAGMLLLPFFIGFLFHFLTSLTGSSKALQSLGFPFMFLCYYLLYRQLKTNGYEQMSTQFKHWASYTLYIYIGILLLGGLILLIAMWLWR